MTRFLIWSHDHTSRRVQLAPAELFGSAEEEKTGQRPGVGLLASIRMPSGTPRQMYEPRHPVAYDLQDRQPSEPEDASPSGGAVTTRAAAATGVWDA
jgi:hypothetical protein